MDETLPASVSVFDLSSDTPLSWEEQRARVERQGNDGRLQFAWLGNGVSVAGILLGYSCGRFAAMGGPSTGKSQFTPSAIYRRWRQAALWRSNVRPTA